MNTPNQTDNSPKQGSYFQEGRDYEFHKGKPIQTWDGEGKMISCLIKCGAKVPYEQGEAGYWYDDTFDIVFPLLKDWDGKTPVELPVLPKIPDLARKSRLEFTKRGKLKIVYLDEEETE